MTNNPNPFNHYSIPYYTFLEENTSNSNYPLENIQIYQYDITDIGLGKFDAEVSLNAYIEDGVVRMEILGNRKNSYGITYKNSFDLKFSDTFLKDLHQITKTSEIDEAMSILCPFLQYTCFISCFSKHQLRADPLVKPTRYTIPSGVIEFAIYSKEIHLNRFIEL